MNRTHKICAPALNLKYQALALALVGGIASTAGAKAESAGGEIERRNELALILAGTYEDTEKKSYFTTGIEYEYRINESFGIGGVAEYITNVDSWVLVVPLTFHPADGLKVFAGPGVEIETRNNATCSHQASILTSLMKKATRWRRPWYSGLLSGSLSDHRT